MSPELRQRIYNDVLRAVLWDEDRQETFDKMSVNGITGEEADAMYGEARKERASMIREGAIRSMFKGLVALMIGAGIFATFWKGLGVITGRVGIICAILGGLGGWWFLTGLIDMILAETKKGSLVSEND